MSVDAGSVRMTVMRIGGLKPKTQKAIERSLVAAGEVLHKEIVKNASNTRYTQSDLDRLGNPYARRHGNIRIHKRNPYVVHKQGTHKRSKNLHKKIKSRLYKRKREFHVYVTKTDVPYAPYVIEGTKVMLGRDFLRATLSDRKVRKKMMKSIIKEMGKEFRTQAAVRFD